MLPQISIDDAETESCLNVTANICPNNLRLIITCRLGTCVRSTLDSGSWILNFASLNCTAWIQPLLQALECGKGENWRKVAGNHVN
jgi:hypothetical protein